jgi:two-component system, sensor histidine kinase and response regulator
MKTILLVDDDVLIRDMFGAALERFGYHTLVAASGTEALDLARRHLPDLIVSDINMPGTDGCTLLQSLRADPELGSKQIVLMTGNRMQPMHRRSMDLGADDFLLKPFSPEELQRCITARFHRAEISRRVETKVIQALQATLHSTLPHEFFTPLAGILGLVEVLKMDITQLSQTEMQEILDDIQRSGLRLHRTLKNYLTLLDLRSDAPPPSGPPTALPPESATQIIKIGAEDVARRS